MEFGLAATSSTTADMSSATPVRANSRQEAAGPFHVRSIVVSKAGHQVLLFGACSDHEQTENHNASHQEEPVRRDQRNGHHEQRGRGVQRMPDPRIGTLYHECVFLPSDNGIRE